MINIAPKQDDWYGRYDERYDWMRFGSFLITVLIMCVYYHVRIREQLKKESMCNKHVWGAHSEL